MTRKKNKSRTPAAQQVRAETATRQLPQIKRKKVNVTGTRGFVAGEINRLTSDMGSSYSLNQDIKFNLSVMRARSRDLALNNSYARRYFKLLKSNVVGPDGFNLSVQGLDLNGVFDPISKSIETHFWRWAMPANCTVTGHIDFAKVQELLIESVARDGEALVILRRGNDFGPYKFQLQVLDADHLDETFDSTASNGNRIVQGVEINEYAKPVAYWIWKNNPADAMVVSQGNERIRIDAQDMIHIFDPERASQVRGYPWMSSAIRALHDIEQFRESVLENARVATDNQVYFKQETNADAFEDEIDDLGYVELDSEKAARSVLPRGWSVEQLDWSQPTTSFGEFQKSILRGAAAGLGISYNTFGADLESVNYSSARFGSLEDQSNYKSIQKWFVNIFLRRVYEEWLSMQMLTNAWGLNIGMDKFNKFANVSYRGRSFGSVDPQKDANSDIALLKAGLTSWTSVIEKRGGVAEEVFLQIQADKQKMQELGITPEVLLQQDLTQSQIASTGAA